MKEYKEWINRALSAYNYALSLTNEKVYYEDKCYQAQQAVEKAIKGLLLYFDVEPEYTHDINKLLIALEKHIDLDECLIKAKSLTKYAIVTRCPGFYENITEDMYLEALDIAESA